MLVCQLYFYTSAHFWLDNQEKTTFNRGLLLIASLSICCHKMQEVFENWEIYYSPVKLIELHEKKPLQSFFIIHHTKKDIPVPKVKEPPVKFRQGCAFESGVKTCKCIRQRMFYLLCTEKLAINFRFRGKSILLGKNSTLVS